MNQPCKISNPVKSPSAHLDITNQSGCFELRTGGFSQTELNLYRVKIIKKNKISNKFLITVIHILSPSDAGCMQAHVTGNSHAPSREAAHRPLFSSF